MRSEGAELPGRVGTRFVSGLLCALVALGCKGQDPPPAAVAADVRPEPIDAGRPPKPAPVAPAPLAVRDAESQPASDLPRQELPEAPAVVTVGAASERLEEPGERSRSQGHARAGKLVRGVQLPDGRAEGYVQTLSRRAWATDYMIAALRRAIAVVRRRHPGIHALFVGDLSARHGGPVYGHLSHQNGRDVDLGFYFEGQPPEGPGRLLSAAEHQLDLHATWTLLVALIGTPEQPHGVKRIYLDRSVQQAIYDWAAEREVPRDILDWMFNYPRGGGMVRHRDGHLNHMHVRFRCAEYDFGCDDGPPPPEVAGPRKVCQRRPRGKRKADSVSDILGSGKRAPGVRCVLLDD